MQGISRFGPSGRRSVGRAGLFMLKGTKLAHGVLVFHSIGDVGYQLLVHAGLLETLEGLATQPRHGVGRPPICAERFERLASRGDVGLCTFQVDVGPVAERSVRHGQRQSHGVRN